MPSANFLPTFPTLPMQLVPHRRRGQFLSPFERFFDDDFFRFPAIFGDDSGMYTPNIDISETDEAVEVRADLPGYKKEDIEVTVENGVLTVSGTMKKETEEKDEDRKYYCRQCSSGSFCRQVSLPVSAEENKAKCRMEDGRLTVTIPKIKEEQEKKGRKLDIE